MPLPHLLQKAFYVLGPLILRASKPILRLERLSKTIHIEVIEDIQSIHGVQIVEPRAKALGSHVSEPEMRANPIENHSSIDV